MKMTEISLMDLEKSFFQFISLHGTSFKTKLFQDKMVFPEHVVVRLATFEKLIENYEIIQEIFPFTTYIYILEYRDSI